MHACTRLTMPPRVAAAQALKAKRAGAAPAPTKLAHSKASLMRPTAGRVVKVAKSAPKVLLAKRIVNKARGRASVPQLVQVAPKSLVNSGKPKQQKQVFQQKQQQQAPKIVVGLPRQQQKQLVLQRPPLQQQQQQQRQLQQQPAQQQHKLTAGQRMAQQRGQVQASRRTGAQQAAGKANRAPINMQPQQQWTLPKGPARGTMHIKVWMRSVECQCEAGVGGIRSVDLQEPRRGGRRRELGEGGVGAPRTAVCTTLSRGGSRTWVDIALRHPAACMRPTGLVHGLVSCGVHASEQPGVWAGVLWGACVLTDWRVGWRPVGSCVLTAWRMGWCALVLLCVCMLAPAGMHAASVGLGCAKEKRVTRGMVKK
mmetsp:Transcript_20762/g.62037  ORF Transcript_20762/g.62037 Transcript_20762/m.62037 type:complete len:368 (-) Transcript_20762:920-2023(-)